MKKTILILVAVIAAYFVCYIAARAAHHGTVSMMVADAQGAQHAQTFQATCFIAPMSGFGRFSSQALFGSFYPLGRLDHLITGRLYEFADQREAPIMKPQP
jgi:hypothetical protein